MIVEIAVLGTWLLKKVGDQVFGEVMDAAKSAEEERRITEAMGRVALEALDEATRIPDKAEIPVPAGLDLRFREFLRCCFRAVVDGQSSIPGSPAGLDREEAENILSPLMGLLKGNAGGVLPATLTEQFCSRYVAFAERVGGWCLSASETTALSVMVRRFLEVFRDRLLVSLPKSTEGAWRERLQEVLAEGFEGIDETLKRGFDQLSSLLGSKWPKTCPDSWKEVVPTAKEYGTNVFSGGETPGAAILRNRILKLIDRTGVLDDRDLPRVEQIYVMASVAEETRRTPGRSIEERPSGQEKGCRQPVLLNLLHHRGIALTGAPGSGKSVELWMTAEHLARRLAGGEGRIVPVYVRLQKEFGGFATVLEDIFATDSLRKLAAAAMAGLDGSRLLLLVDSLDEAGKATSTGALRELRDLLKLWPGLSFVVAGRAQSRDWWRDNLAGELTRARAVLSRTATGAHRGV